MDNTLGGRGHAQRNGLDPFWLWVTPHILLIVLLARLGWALLMNMGFGPPRHHLVLAVAPEPLAIRAVVKSFRTKTLAAPFSGTVQRLEVQPGDRVHRGQLLLTMHVDEYRRRERAARQNAAAAAKEVRNARRQRATALRQLSAERRGLQAKLRYLKRLQAEQADASVTRAPVPDTGEWYNQPETQPSDAGVEAVNVAEMIRLQETAAQRAEYEGRFAANALARKNLAEQFHRTIAAALKRRRIAETEVRRLRPYLQQARQVSPIDGMVTEVRTAADGWVDTDDPLVRVDDSTAYRLVTLIRKDPKGRIKPGLSVPVRIGNRDARATVARLEPGRGRTLFYTWVYLKPAHPELVTYGQLAQVTLPRGTVAAPLQVAGTPDGGGIGFGP